MGIGPGSNLHLVTMDCTANSEECGLSTINLEVENLTDEDTKTIGTPQGYPGTVILLGCFTTGDVNEDGTVDIIDALLTAQYYVGLDVSINLTAGDVNCNGSVDIIDALLIAQYYVGLDVLLC